MLLVLRSRGQDAAQHPTMYRRHLHTHTHTNYLVKNVHSAKVEEHCTGDMKSKLLNKHISKSLTSISNPTILQFCLIFYSRVIPELLISPRILKIWPALGHSVSSRPGTQLQFSRLQSWSLLRVLTTAANKKISLENGSEFRFSPLN